MSATGPVTIDDTDPMISYQGNWQQKTSGGEDYKNTVHLSQSNTATATFNFNGSSVTVFGTAPPSTPPTSNYTLDNLPPVSFTSQNVSAPTFQQQLYTSPPLDDGPHTLIIQPTVNGANFYLDFIRYTPTKSSFTSSNTTTSTSKSNAGPIAGGLVGGLAALGILAALLFFFRRWLRKSNIDSPRADLLAPSAPSPPMRNNPVPTPFVLPPPPPATTTLTSKSSGILVQRGPSGPSTQGTTTSTPTPSQVESSGDLEPIQHQDGGSLPIQLQRAELPPVYESRGIH